MASERFCMNSFFFVEWQPIDMSGKNWKREAKKKDYVKMELWDVRFHFKVEGSGDDADGGGGSSRSGKKYTHIYTFQSHIKLWKHIGW